MLARWNRVEDGFEWICTRVYGPNDDSIRYNFWDEFTYQKKKNLWDELKEVQQRWSIPWCLLRDFNVVRFPSEQLERSRFSSAMFEFFEFIEELNLLDLCL